MEKGKKYDVFISCSIKDYFDDEYNVIQGNAISRVMKAFDKAHITYWFDPDGIDEGQMTPEAINAIINAPIFLFFSSANHNASARAFQELRAACYYSSVCWTEIVALRIEDVPFSHVIELQLEECELELEDCRDNCFNYYANAEEAIGKLVKIIKDPSRSLFGVAEAIGLPTMYSPVSEGLPTGCFDHPRKRKRGFLEGFKDFLLGTKDGVAEGKSGLSDNVHFVYGSVFAPNEICRKTRMAVQVFLHLLEETEKVKALALESQPDVRRRDYIPLQCPLKVGDKVDVQLNVYGDTLLMSERKTLIWQGSFTKCRFSYFVPENLACFELSCAVLLSVNGIPVGEMGFSTSITDKSRGLNAEVLSHEFKKVFISYAHLDEPRVKYLAEGFRAMGADYFFDRHYLKTGEVFPKAIQDYIDCADLFILCWSENAAKSEYVKKELMQALERAYPNATPGRFGSLSIYPLSIEPRAELPEDMKKCYQFGEL